MMSRIAKLKFSDYKKIEIESKFNKAINSNLIEQYSSKMTKLTHWS